MLYHLPKGNKNAILAEMVKDMEIYRKTETGYTDWTRIAEILPTLSPEEAAQSVMYLHEGEVRAANQLDPSLKLYDSQGLNIEVIGSPHIYKTTVLTRLYADYRKLGIPIELIREQRPSFPVNESNAHDFNLVMAMIAAKQLIEQDNKPDRLIRGPLRVWDRSVHNALPFLLTEEGYETEKVNWYRDNLPTYIFDHNYRRHLQSLENSPIRALVQHLSSRFHALIIVKASPEISIQQGSTMNEKYLGRLLAALEDTPKAIARLRSTDSEATAKTPLPVLTINLDTDGLNYQETFDKSMGFILKQYYQTHFIRNA